MSTKDYIYDNKCLSITEEMFIGSGSQWEVFRIKLENADIKSMIYKKSTNNNPYSYKHNLEMYKNIKKAGLKTLEFYESGMVDNDFVIFAQDLKMESVFYVSPNSARKKGNIQELLTCLTQGKEFDEYQGVPEIEKYLLQNKLKKINNFDDIFLLIHDEMEIATANDICTCADAFFFGINLNLEIITDIVIADFDNVNKFKISKSNKSGNEIEMISSYWEFIDNFVEKEASIKYKKMISDKIIKLQGKKV